MSSASGFSHHGSKVPSWLNEEFGRLGLVRGRNSTALKYCALCGFFAAMMALQHKMVACIKVNIVKVIKKRGKANIIW